MSTRSLEWKSHPLFEGLNEEYLDLLVRSSREESYESRELIIREGDDADAFYLIAEGTVAIEIFANERGPVTIDSLNAGEVLGWSWLVPPHQWHFDAQATTRTRMISFDAAMVRDSFDSYPDFGYAMMKRFIPIIVQRLQATRIQLLDVYHVRG